MTRTWGSGAVLLIAILLSLLIQPFAYAQEVAGDLENEENFSDPVGAPAGTVSCFDYYAFGSVQANVVSELTSTVSGTTITFTGTLTNSNPYPLVDGTLYVKIFKNRSASDGNGPDVVDQFVAMDNVTIPAKGSVPASFEWRIPAHAVSGDYRLATYFTTSDAFNLLGLTFTDDVIGNVVPFTITGEQNESVMFDKSSVTVDGQQFLFAAFPPQVDAQKPIDVSAAIRNTSDSPQEARVSWVIYRWDAQKQSNVVHTEEDRVMVPAGGTAPVSVAVADNDFTVYYVVGTLTWNDAKSVIGVRFGRVGPERFRINFPSIISFPLKAGQANTMFACLHNTSDTEILPGGRLELALTDSRGNTIAEHVYDGEVTSAMMGVASQFTPEEDYDTVTLKARLFQNGELVDEADVMYDCSAIDPSQCNPKAAGFSNITFLSLAGLLAILIALIALFTWMRRKPEPVQQAPLY
jgi:hypothetical protein